MKPAPRQQQHHLSWRIYHLVDRCSFISTPQAAAQAFALSPLHPSFDVEVQATLSVPRLRLFDASRSWAWWTMKKRFPLPRGAFSSMSMPVEQQDALEALAELQLDQHLTRDKCVAGVCTQRRKLAWRLQHKGKLPSGGALVPPEQCPLCRKGLDRAFSSPTRCEMCGVRMCSRCSVSQKLLFPGAFGSKETHAVTVELCAPCITRTTEEDAIAIARQEIRAGQYGALTSPRGVTQRKRAFNVVKPRRRRVDLSASAGPPVTINPPPRQPRVDFAASAGPARTRVDGDDDGDGTVIRQSLQALDNLLQGPKDQREGHWEHEPSHTLTPKQVPMTLADLEDPDSGDGVPTKSTPPSAAKSSSPPLWKRMSALQVTTQKTTEKTQHLSHSGCSPSYTSPPTRPEANELRTHNL
ncbi:hypothetical protein PF002_g19261 [Phytophthora fragariae]|uniref:FYVE-type domain-containing protein n=2 Tax=Phytophthora fragariae TaxID=53985 RepID=A0A6A3JNP4_9STRA|nr:hypothetical protein PF011_g16892 [Phytophthora fragariae]KAE9095996.1 hypothetical protein PF007_g17172 [Phytophthora fragariae]KAE9208923.1 hypothetical protein PF002_g19261 [Phytophthora fragariae]